MIEFRTWAEHTRQLQVNPEAMLAQAYRQIVEVGNLFGENPMVAARVNAILEHMDELKTMTEVEEPLGEKGDGIDHETEGEKPVKQVKPSRQRKATKMDVMNNRAINAEFLRGKKEQG